MGIAPIATRYDAGITDLADALGIGANTVRREIAAGRIPYIRVGKQYRFNVGEVVESYRRQSR
jgi:excisionase family DNA binding protein